MCFFQDKIIVQKKSFLKIESNVCLSLKSFVDLRHPFYMYWIQMFTMHCLHQELVQQLLGWWITVTFWTSLHQSIPQDGIYKLWSFLKFSYSVKNLSKNLIWYQAPAKRTTLPSASSVPYKKSPILQTKLSLLNVICCTCSTTGAVFTTYVGILVFSASALIWSFSLIIRDVKISQQGKD